LPGDEYPLPLVLFRTFELWLLQVVMSLSLQVVVASQKIRSTILDETAADVWNYVHSLGGEVVADSPLAACSQRILDRFLSAWERARVEGPVDEIHVIAHSLGSVIAYHGMAWRVPAESIHRLITIGSPLEKVRFLWAKLFPPEFRWSCEWLNFHSPSDPVSGKLKRFDINPQRRIQNTRLWGIGGYGEAHLGYFRDPRVMRVLAGGLGLSAASENKFITPSWFKRRAFDIGVPVLTVLLMLGGLLIMCLFFYVVVWLTGMVVELPLRLFSRSFSVQAGHAWRVFWSWIMLPLWLLYLTKDGYNRCVTRHQRSWRPSVQ
jgi:hypothetical protein